MNTVVAGFDTTEINDQNISVKKNDQNISAKNQLNLYYVDNSGKCKLFVKYACFEVF